MHSGHAFHGGLWDMRPYNPDYVRLYKQYPDFQQKFLEIVGEVSKFVPAPTEENGGRLAAVRKYLSSFQCNGDGKSILKSDFAKIIHEEFSALNPQEFPIMASYFSSEKILSLPTGGLTASKLGLFARTDSTEKSADAIVEQAIKLN